MQANLPLADELAALTARIADLLLTHETVDEAVSALAQALKEAIPGALGAGVSLMDTRGRRTSTASTDPAIVQADQLQYDLRQGPCLTAWAQQATVTVGDARTDHRWPAWSRAIAGLPLRSVISTPLSTPEGAIGALKVYSPVPDGLDSRAIRLLELLARPAALMLANTQARDAAQRLSDGLIGALGARDAVGVASGIVMERHHINRDQALATLISASRRRNEPLHQLARDIIDGAEL
ncbi:MULTISPECIES: GAF and ANTAR domain-containing protein [unclassified Arthrobacter]|uniref:GAF and ANTAR domain-containing protein n=1 Tax=unclassified Arthrobacter TaxID=235627 RepID=UPI001F3179C7|nr:GAF and ANTAR domain-containing protein [Arthrobacter sp. FW305-BF8]UKA53560.1 GAF and ANTAR domain-containing protein [Arthrobacter sp. FW305-BF8]